MMELLTHSTNGPMYPYGEAHSARLNSPHGMTWHVNLIVYLAPTPAQLALHKQKLGQSCVPKWPNCLLALRYKGAYGVTIGYRF